MQHCENSENWKTRFFTIWTGQQLSLIGSRIADFALVWWVTATTGSATILATAMMVAMLPQVVLAPFAGAILDRQNRQRVMMVADGCVAMLSVWLAYLFWADSLQIWHIYGFMFVRALGGAFHWPAMQASTSLMVPDEQLSRVQGLDATMMGIRSIAAPPLAALLLELLPMFGLMAIDVVTAAIAITPLFFVHIPQPHRSPSAKEEKQSISVIWRDVREGFAYVYNWSGLFRLLIMATALNFVLSPAMSLLPILVTRRLGGGALELASGNSAWGLGLLVGGVLMSAWGGFERRIVTTMVGVIGLGIGSIVVGLAPAGALSMAVAGLALMGFTNPAINGPLMAIVQSRVEPSMQGRVFTVISSMAGAMSPLSMAVAGPLADWLGVHVWYIAGGIVCIGMAIIGFLMPSIMHIEDHVQPCAAPQSVESPAVASE